MIADGSHCEIEKKLRYLKNLLTDFDEIWIADAFWPSKPYGPRKKIKILKSKTSECHHYENKDRHLPLSINRKCRMKNTEIGN